jgi:O-Antigen ligase
VRKSPASFVRISSALLLIALEFTSLVAFLAEGGATPVTTPHSRYPVYFASYGICALIMALDLKSARRFVQKPVVRWAFAALILFTWGMLVRMFNAPAGIDDYDFFRTFGLRVNNIGFVLCCTMIFDDPDALQITKRAVLVATLAGVALNIYDVMFPGTFSNDPGRAAGLYVNPNVSGISLVFGCAIGLSTIRSRWWQEAFVLISFIGVLMTFSREAILAFGCVVVCGNLSGRLALRRLTVVGGVAVALFVAFNMGNNLLSEKVASTDKWSRLSSYSDSSATGRAHLAERTLSAFEEAPLLGQGFGTGFFWDDLGSHNFYLSLLADHGIFGILLIPALILSIGRKSWDFYAFAAAFLVFCLFSHNVFDEVASLISLAIQAAEAHPRHTVFDLKPTSLAYGRT